MQWLMILLALLFAVPSSSRAEFPALIPLEKPNYAVSAAVARQYDQWNPHEDRGNELYSNFKYTPLEGLELKPNISRRDPTKVLLIDGVYHVWYTCRKTAGVPAGGKGATDMIPSFDWDPLPLQSLATGQGHRGRASRLQGREAGVPGLPRAAGRWAETRRQAKLPGPQPAGFPGGVYAAYPAEGLASHPLLRLVLE